MHILLATDGSADGNAGAELLCQHHAGPYDRVTIAVVTPSLQLPEADLRLPPGETADHDRVAEAIASETAQRLEEAGYRVTVSLLHGDPAEEIIRLAETTNADLLVLGQKGIGALRRLLIGSVAATVGRRSAVPVLLARTPAAFSRTLVVSDNTPVSQRAAEVVLEIPAASIDHVAFLLINRAGDEGDSIASAFQAAATTLEDAGIDVRMLEATGNEVEVALETAENEHATLIVVAASDALVDDEPLLGTTAHGLLERAPCSILIAR
ncbi:MAG: universal stress protein [Thermomicrobiales bacterium]